MAYLFVALGGALGAMARFGLHSALPTQAIPWGTLSANLLGCLAMGLLMQAIVGSNGMLGGVIAEHHRLLFAVGFCGSFTTLSAFMYEVNTLLQRNEIVILFSYLSVTLLGGFACFALGAWLARLAAN